VRLFRGLSPKEAVRGATGVRHTAELDRVLALPRRDFDLDEVRVALTEHMRTPQGEQEFWPDQALFLNDLFECRGAFANMRVGAGKTLAALVASTLLKLPTVLLVPSELVDKTEDEAKDYAKHWDFEMPELLGYGMLSHKDHAEDLVDMKPKMIVADEGQHLFNLADAACARRVRDYLYTDGVRNDCIFAVLSGTLVDVSLLNYHHLMLWALGPERMPLPADPEVAIAWAQALDPEPPMSKGRLKVGALKVFGPTPAKANTAIGKFIGATPGCIYTKGKGIGTSLQIRAWYPSRSPAVIRKTIDEVLRTRKRPDGLDLDDTEVGRVISQLHLGFYLYWKPAAPKPWLKARKEWYGYGRRVKSKDFGGLDSMARIEEAIEAEGLEIRELQAWQAIRDEYKPNVMVQWLSDVVLQSAVGYARQQPNCVVWSSYRCVGRRLQELGLPHFGKGGKGPGGLSIDKTKDMHISASIQANHKGRNLQYQFNHSLVLNPPGSARMCEQLIGRTHRERQKASTVYIHVLASRDMKKVLRDSEHLSRVGRFKSKLTIADWVGF
jgi:hypothetical protein